MSAAPLPKQNRLLADRSFSAQISEATLHVVLSTGQRMVIRWTRDALAGLHQMQNSGFLLGCFLPGNLDGSLQVSIDRLLPVAHSDSASSGIIGIFRKQLEPPRDGAIQLTGNDVALLGQVCSGPSALALLITGNPDGGPASASLFVKTRDFLDSATPAKTFSLPGGSLSFSPESIQGRKWGAVAAAISFAACGGIFVAASFGNGLWKERKKADSPLFGARLGITTALSPSGALQLQWDGAAKAIREADRAQISVASVTGEEQVPLTSADLRKGFYIWDGSPGSVLFRLSVNTPSGEVTESIRSLVPVAPAAKQTQADLGSTQTVPPGDLVTARKKEGGASGTRSRRRTVQTFALPVNGLRSNQSGEAGLPSLELAAAPSLAIPGRLDPLAPAPSILGSSVRPRPQVVAAIEPQRPSLFKKVFGIGGGEWQPPTPARRMNPALKTFSSAPDKVSIRLSIDKRGEVSNAELLTKNLDRGTNLAVMEAARQWRFQPARSGQDSISSTVLLHFQVVGVPGKSSRDSVAAAK